MSLRLEMLQVARLAPRLLGDSTECVRGFLSRQQNEDGGFCNRAGASDLYYTVFALEALLALETSGPISVSTVELFARAFEFFKQIPIPNISDLVHLSCLARVASALEQVLLAPALSFEQRKDLAGALEKFRAEDGGYRPAKGQGSSTVYSGFLACAGYQDLQLRMPAPERLIEALGGLRSRDGAWANEGGLAQGSTNATAAAIALCRQLRAAVPEAAGDWLVRQQHAQGGFLAAPGAPMPDLLSTATALHALAGVDRDLGPHREVCLDFIDSLWTNAGGFYGCWSDEILDVEYTFYGLLALGHLSVS